MGSVSPLAVFNPSRVGQTGGGNVTSKDPGEPAQTRRWHRLAILCVTVAVLVPMLAACGGTGSSNVAAPATSISGNGAGPATSVPGSSAPATPIPSPSASAIPSPSPSASAIPSPSANPYRQFDQDVARLLDRQVAWQAPKRIQVDQTARVGLVIGDPSLLKAQIRQLVPGSYPKPSGNVRVGSTIGVQLLADPNDASVTPSDAIDESMGEHTALLWTWYVNAKHPSQGLLLTAQIVTKMSDGHVQQKELALTIPVDRTPQYTLYQIFSNWATWAAIVAALGTTVGAIWRGRKKQQRKKPKNKKEKSRENKNDLASWRSVRLSWRLC